MADFWNNPDDPIWDEAQLLANEALDEDEIEHATGTPSPDDYPCPPKPKRSGRELWHLARTHLFEAAPSFRNAFGRLRAKYYPRLNQAAKYRRASNYLRIKYPVGSSIPRFGGRPYGRIAKYWDRTSTRTSHTVQARPRGFNKLIRLY